MSAIKVIGIGSPFGSDQVGWLVVESLEKEYSLQTLTADSVQFLNCDRPGVSLLHYFEGADYVILIDAIDGGRKGSFVKLNKAQLLNNSTFISSHNLGVAETLTLGSHMGSLPKKLDLFGMHIGGSGSEYHPDSASLNAMNQQVIRQIQQFLSCN